jgi:DNA-binding LacI/PurR family transcriptional regulator
LLDGLGEAVSGTPEERLGIVAYNDTMAIGVLEALDERRLVVGRDAGLIGFDDQLVSQTAGLSTVRPPLEEMALTAVRLLVEALNGEQKHSRIGCLPQVIVRRSTRRD